jgi:hypothetical protein
MSPDGSRAAMNSFTRTASGCVAADTISLVSMTGKASSAGVRGVPIGWLDPTHLIFSPGTFDNASGPAMILNTKTHSQRTVDDEDGAFGATTYGL